MLESITQPVTNSSEISLQVLGGGRDVGRSCMLLSLLQRNILLDCGAHPGYSDHRRYPQLNNLPKLDAVVITHFHFDHAAALPLLTRYQPEAPVYMTEPTRDLSRLMLLDVIATSSSRGQACPYRAEDVDACLAHVKLLTLGESVIGKSEDIDVSVYYAGHVLGAVMVYLAHEGSRAFYTGDFCTTPDRHLRSANVPIGLHVDLLITEATYCQTSRKTGRWEAETEIANAVVSAIKRDGKVLFPVSAFGRVHAVCALLDAHCAREVQRVPVYLSAGLASRACKEYSRFREWCVYEECRICADGSKRKRGFADACTHRTVDRLQEFGRNEWNVVTRRGPVILFCTPGSLKTGLSLEVLRVWGRGEKNLVVVPGLTLGDIVAGGLLDDYTGEGAVETGLRCQVVNASFGAHADRRGLVRVCMAIKSRCVVLVHGNEDGVMEFQKAVEKNQGVRCVAPRNGETVIVAAVNEDERGNVEPGGQDGPVAALEQDGDAGKERELAESESLKEWRKVISIYEEMTRALKTGEQGETR